VTRVESIQVHPHTCVFSLYGRYVLPRGGEIWTGSLIQALTPLGFSAGAVRTLVSRMQRKGLLQGRRVGRRSFYRLTDRGLHEVSWGGGRAFASDREKWDGSWTVVVYSIPEKQRQCRDTLRNSLTALGFGPLAPGAWISPQPLSPEAERKWQKLEVRAYLDIFRAEHLGPSDSRGLVAQAWPQLPALADRYQSYVAIYEPLLRRFAAGLLSDQACFAAHLRSLIEFVTITLGDPTLPPALLPPDWPRPAAQSLLESVQQTLGEPAGRFFDAIFETEIAQGGSR